jgi:site-specific recombinase XerD
MVFKSGNIEKAKDHVKKVDILKENQNHILNFIEQIAAEGLSKTRQQKYIYTLISISRMIDKDYNKLTKQDIVKLCSEINNSELAEWTKHDRLVAIKRFMKYIYEQLGETYDKGEYPACVKWIRTTIKQNRRKNPDDLLDAEDVKKLANHTNNLRDRAMVLVLYESAGRISEIQNIKVKQVVFDKYGCLVDLHGKTGPRRIRLISSAPAISNWLTDHPKKALDDFRDSYLFCSLWGKNRGEYLSYPQINLLLRETAVKAGVKKPVRPHWFRHSRGTELAKRLTESQLCEYLGWVQGSKEASTYVHLSGRDTDKAILSMYGLIEEDISKDKLQPIECPRCGIKNDPAAKFCSGCSLGLDEISMMEYDKRQSQLGNIEEIIGSERLNEIIGNDILKEIASLKEEIQKIKNREK